jgi:hypothetical protein
MHVQQTMLQNSLEADSDQCDLLQPYYAQFDNSGMLSVRMQFSRYHSISKLTLLGQPPMTSHPHRHLSLEPGQ